MILQSILLVLSLMLACIHMNEDSEDVKGLGCGVSPPIWYIHAHAA